MSVSSVVSPFNCLLNSINDNLSAQNLQSLIHICEEYIPESRREEIRNGLDVFRILKHQNVIGDDGEKIHNLEQIVRAIRPKRRDIIKKVRTFTRTCYDAGHEFLSSGESNFFYSKPAAVLVDNHRQPPPLDRHNSSPGRLDSLSGSQMQSSNDVLRSTNTENHCTIDCCCLGCNCYARQIPSCVLLILTGIMAILSFLATVLWFGKMPKNLYNKLSPDASSAGGYVVGGFVVATIGFLCWWIYRKVHVNRHVFHVPYQNFTNPVDLPVTPSTVDAEKGSTNPSATVDLPNNTQKTRRFGSVPAQSSLETAASASLMEREQRRHLNSLTGDDCLQTDGACASGETDEFQSRESLFPVDSLSDYSSDEPTTVPPMTAE